MLDTDTQTYAYLGSEYMNLPCEPETWLIRPLVPMGGSVLIYGEPKVGKSYAAIQLAASIDSGKDWLGFEVMKNGPVLYCQLDTPRNLWVARLKELKSSGVSPVDNIICADRETFQEFPFNITDPNHYLKLRRTVDRFNPVVVMIDTLREVHPGDENESANMRNVIAALAGATHPAALILISHSRKPKEEQEFSIMNDIRGSNYVPGRMDAIIHMGKHSLQYSGRAIEEGMIKLHRADNGFWTPATQDIDSLIERIKADGSYKNTSEQARALAEATGKTEQAARGLIRRAERRHEKMQGITLP